MTDEEWNVANNLIGIGQSVTDRQEKEIERLRKYETMVHFIANDYYELSHEKIKWQRDDWKKRCGKLIEEDHKDD